MSNFASLNLQTFIVAITSPHMKYLAFSISIIGLVIVCGCHSADHWDQRAIQLEADADRLDMAYLQINRSIDSLWDSTTACIARTMPETIPPVDREIFLTSRNANHIRMFESFHMLPETTQSLVDKAAIEDQKLADRLADLAVQKQMQEKERMAFLSELASQEPGLLNRYADRFRATNHHAE